MSGWAGLERVAGSWYELLIPLAAEAAVLGLVIWCVARLGRRLASPVRYGLLLVAIAKFVVPPIGAPWTVPVELSQLDGLVAEAGAPAVDWKPEIGLPDSSDPSAVQGSPASRLADGGRLLGQAKPGSSPGELPSSPPDLAPRSSRRLQLPAPMAALLLIHLVGACVLLARRGRQLSALRTMSRRSRPVDDPRLAAILETRRVVARPDYIRAMSGAASRRFDVDELVTLRRYEIEPAYVSGLAAVGFEQLPVSDMVRLKRYEVDPEFIGRLQRAGFEELTIDRIIRMKRAEG